MKLQLQLDEQHSEKIQYLQRHLNINFDLLIQQGIDLLYEKQCQSSPVFKILQETGFIGCIAGESLLSENYKAVIDLEYKL
jgi:hypothetical protein